MATGPSWRFRMILSRRNYLRLLALGTGGLATSLVMRRAAAREQATNDATRKPTKDLTIKELRVTPIALPDPPLLAASGCHGPYYLRTIVEVVTTEGVTGV